MNQTGDVPMLRPHQEMLRALEQVPREKLLVVAERRGVAVPADATQADLANLLVQHQFYQQSEQQYRETGTAFDSRAFAYPPLREIVEQRRPRAILDVGCGPAFFAEELHANNTLPPDGEYFGFDHSEAAIELAKQKLAHDARFQFFVGDATRLTRHADVDVIVIAFVLSYLDTRAVHELVAALARHYPRATLVTALTFRSCVDRLPGVEPDETREIERAHAFLAGDTSVAEGVWDVRRFEWYKRSIEAHYEITTERVLDTAQLLWSSKPRA
jgi:SAM-dependent methyltransferase